MSKKQRKAKKQKARDKAARVKAWRAYRARTCGGRIWTQYIPALYEYVPADAIVLYSESIIGELDERFQQIYKLMYSKDLAAVSFHRSRS